MDDLLLRIFLGHPDIIWDVQSAHDVYDRVYLGAWIYRVKLRLGNVDVHAHRSRFGVSRRWNFRQARGEEKPHHHSDQPYRRCCRRSSCNQRDDDASKQIHRRHRHGPCLRCRTSRSCIDHPGQKAGSGNGHLERVVPGRRCSCDERNAYGVRTCRNMACELVALSDTRSRGSYIRVGSLCYASARECLRRGIRRRRSDEAQAGLFQHRHDRHRVWLLECVQRRRNWRLLSFISS